MIKTILFYLFLFFNQYCCKLSSYPEYEHEKKPILENYWPLASLKDVVGNGDLYGGGNYLFTCDRFNKPTSAIYITHGYLNIPSGKYLTGDFTITCWIQLISYQYWSSIINFGNGEQIDEINLTMNSTTSQIGLESFYDPSSDSSELGVTSTQINLFQWYHIAAVLKKTTAYMYINGVEVAKGAFLNAPRDVIRTKNFIGISNFEGYTFLLNLILLPLIICFFIFN